MFRITANYDDPRHPLQGDVVTVASVMEAMAVVEGDEQDEWEINEVLDYGGKVTLYGFGVTYIVERI